MSEDGGAMSLKEEAYDSRTLNPANLQFECKSKGQAFANILKLRKRGYPRVFS